MAFLIFASTAISSASSSAAMRRRVLPAMSRGRTDGEHLLGLPGGDVPLRLAWQEFGQQRLESAHGLDPATGERLAAVGQHPHRLELAVDLEHPQVRGADGDDRDRVGVEGVGLAVVAGVEEPDPGGELGRHVDDVLAGLEQPLGERTSGTVGALDRPDPVRPGLGVGPHRRVAGLVGGEPSRAEQLLVLVDDLDRRRQLVGIDPDDDLLHALLPPVLVPIGTARWALLLRAGQSPLEPRLVTVPGGPQTEREPHPRRVGSPKESEPAEHLDRVWPDTGPAGSL